MDAVVIGTFLAVGGTIVIGLYAGYRFIKIINGKRESE